MTRLDCSTAMLFAALIVVGTTCLAQAQASSGDMNCDSTVNGSDIGPFVLALIDPSGYEAAYEACQPSNADFDCDESADTDDVDGFVDCVLHGNCVQCGVVIETVIVDNPGKRTTHATERLAMAAWTTCTTSASTR